MLQIQCVNCKSFITFVALRHTLISGTHAYNIYIYMSGVPPHHIFIYTIYILNHRIYRYLCTYFCTAPVSLSLAGSPLVGIVRIYVNICRRNNLLKASHPPPPARGRARFIRFARRASSFRRDDNNYRRLRNLGWVNR